MARLWLLRLALAVALVVVAAGASVPAALKATFVKAFGKSLRAGNTTALLQLLALEDAGEVLPVNEVGRDERTPLMRALHGAHDFLEGVQPGGVEAAAVTLAEWDAVIAGLLAHGAVPGLLCPLYEAVVFSNAPALVALLAAQNTSETAFCVNVTDANGEGVFHVGARTKAAGLARIFIRLRDGAVVGPGVAAARDAVARHLGVAAAPQWTAAGELTKRALEESAGVRDMVAVLASAAAHGVNLPAVLATRNREGQSPLHIACAHGRPALVTALLAAGAPAHDVTGTPANTSESRNFVAGDTCLTLAAARGYTSVLVAAGEYFASASSPAAAADWGAFLTQHDAYGRTPGTMARLHGAVGAPFADAWDAAVTAAGLLPPLPPPSSHSLPPLFPTRAGLVLRHFNATEAALAGWRVASPDQLAYVGMARDLWSTGNGRPGGTPCHMHDAGVGADGRIQAATHDCGSAFPIPVITAAQLEGEAAAVQAHLQVPQLPFIIETGGAWRPFAQAAAAAAAGDAATTTTRRDVLHALGHLEVTTGALPYAATYGAPSTVVPLGQFVRAHMGAYRLAARDGNVTRLMAAAASRPAAPLLEALDAVDRTPADAATGGWTPQYVFDGRVVQRAAAAFAPLLARIAAGVRREEHSMQQLAMGPPLSGAMPHFHGPAVNVLAVGVKLWVLVPPEAASFTALPAASWFHDVYLPACATGASLPSCPPHYAFLQEPGDVVVVPEHWGHAVLNLADTLAAAME